MPRPSRSTVSPSLFLLSLLATVSFATFARAQSEPLPPPSPPPPTDPVAPPADPVAPPAALPPSTPVAPTPAELPPPDERAPRTWKPMMRAGGGVEAYWFSAKGVGSTFPIIPYGMFALSSKVLLDVHLPLSFSTRNGGGLGSDKAAAGIGNPTLGLTYVTTDARTTWHVGMRISAPVSGASDGRAWQVANVLGAISMALYDLHYWAYKYVPVGGRVGVEYQANPGVFLRGSFEPTIFAPVDGQNASSVLAARKTLLLYQGRVELEGRSDSGWGGGAGLQIVHVLSGGEVGRDSDNAQGAIEPFVSYDSATTFARLGFLLAIDSPLGPGLDPGKVAALRMNLGSHF